MDSSSDAEADQSKKNREFAVVQLDGQAVQTSADRQDRSMQEHFVRWSDDKLTYDISNGDFLRGENSIFRIFSNIFWAYPSPKVHKGLEGPIKFPESQLQCQMPGLVHFQLRYAVALPQCAHESNAKCNWMHRSSAHLHAPERRHLSKNNTHRWFILIRSFVTNSQQMPINFTDGCFYKYRQLHKQEWQ